jgi:hypothetical protein
MSNRVNTFKPDSFINKFGQTINPGDQVIYVGSGYAHKITVNAGIFEGVYIGEKYDWTTKQKSPQVVGVRIGQIFHYEDEGKKYYRKAVLPLMRVFKINTTMEEFAGKEL